MVNALEAKRRVAALRPSLDGWNVYDDVAAAPAPPWIVMSVTQIGRDVNEAVDVTSRLYTLTARVVGVGADGVNVACERCMEAFDGRHPEGMGALVPYSDSGVYDSGLTNPQTGRDYPMRVLAWRFGE